jgi:2-dehydro-3-deoxygluconokinase
MGKQVVTFGEVMLRLSSPGHERLGQAASFTLQVGGSEANVAVSLAGLGHAVRHLCVLPPNDLGDRVLRELRGLGVDTSGILRGGTRLGLNFCEKGIAQRPSKVLYDRAHSAMAECAADAFDWSLLLENASWLHLSGITPALSEACAGHALAAFREARRRKIPTSLDLNYRKSLWSREQAREVLGGLASRADLLITNEEDAEAVFGIHGSDPTKGGLDPQGYREVARQLAERFGCPQVAITLRDSHSASRNGWGGLLYHLGDGTFAVSPTYDIQICDRVGSGDAFAAGLVHGFLHGWTTQEAVEFAAAAGCLKHTVEGDFNLVTEQEILRLAAGNGSGRVER